jgi:hypothetical protein
VEARKCSLRHRRCHSTFDNGTVYGFDDIPHGRSGYEYYGCRCETCVNAVNKASRDNRRNRRANDPVWREAENKLKRDVQRDKYAIDLDYRAAQNKRNRDADRVKRATDPVWLEAERKRDRDRYARKKAAKAESATRVPTRVDAISDQIPSLE